MQAPQMARPSGYRLDVAKRSILPTPARDVVAANLKALGIGGNDPQRVRYADIGNVSASHVRRIREKLSGATVDALYEIAAHFKMETWCLLHPTMDGRISVQNTPTQATESGTMEGEATPTEDEEVAREMNWSEEAERFKNYFLELTTHDRRRYLEEIRLLAERTERAQAVTMRSTNVSALRKNQK